MKTRMIMLCLALPYFLMAQTAVEEFYQSHQERENSLHFTIGNWFFEAGSWILEDANLQQLLKKSNRARLLLSEEEGFVSQAEIKRLIKETKREGYVPLAKIKSNGHDFQLFALEDGKRVSHLLLLASDPEYFSMISLDCSFELDDVQCLLDEL